MSGVHYQDVVVDVLRYKYFHQKNLLHHEAVFPELSEEESVELARLADHVAADLDMDTVLVTHGLIYSAFTRYGVLHGFITALLQQLTQEQPD